MKITCGDFNLKATLESGQVFGFSRTNDGAHEGFIAGEPVRLWQERVETQNFASLHIASSNGLKPAVVSEYFDLGLDLSGVYKILQDDENLIPAYRAFKGLRLIRQDPWEALACFIISSNNNVKRIQGIWKDLTGYFCRDAKFCVSIFPQPIQIANTHERILRQLGLGYRAPFLWATAKFLSTNPDYLETIRETDYEEAKARVISFPGIGPKVADCALLYGFHKLEAFPVDVWILRVMRRFYFRNRRVTPDKVRQFAMKRWGPHAGYVQQYLFHSARMGLYDILKK